MSANIALRMLRTVDGSLNGRDVTTYQAGERYDLPDQGAGGLADVFLREGWAEVVLPISPPEYEHQVIPELSVTQPPPEVPKSTRKRRR